jgi:transcriptional regulator with XRE-family HTH domain
MRTIGQRLKEARSKKKYSVEKLEKETKIKGEFIKSIEKEEWDKLPDFPVVQGFVKSISQTLGMDERGSAALLRRDYPPKELKVNPEPDVSEKFTWSPRLTFFVGIAVVTLALLSYLGYEYYLFVRPPSLRVSTPTEGQVVETNTLEVAGDTEPDVTLRVNNQPVLVEEDGDFTTVIEISSQTNEIIVRAISRSGKETVIRRKIEPQLKE